MNIRSIRFALAVLAGVAGVAHAQRVAPPPLPIGSALVRPEPGMSEPEQKRAMRAHHHKFQQGKDYTRDDSVYGHESLATNPVHPVGGNAGAQGGAGTGPAREKTDKGASSYFFGNDKK
jgi:hypothetical protein